MSPLNYEFMYQSYMKNYVPTHVRLVRHFVYSIRKYPTVVMRISLLYAGCDSRVVKTLDSENKGRVPHRIESCSQRSF